MSYCSRLWRVKLQFDVKLERAATSLEEGRDPRKAFRPDRKQ